VGLVSALGPLRLLLVAALLLLVNVPVAASLLTDRRVAADGERVSAEVVQTAEEGDDHGVALRFDADVDPSERTWPVRVDEATYDVAVRDRVLDVRAVPGDPGAFAVPGQVGNSTGVWMTLLGNLLIAAWVWAMLRRARRRAAGEDDPDEGLGTGPA
jgi:hypothetical protein